MAEKPEPFKVPDGRMVKTYRHKVKRPRITGFRVEGRKLMAILSCGHESVYCRLPKWTHCYKCPVETIHFERPAGGYRTIPFTTTKPQ